MKIKPFDEIPIIEGDDIILKRIDYSDKDKLKELSNSKNVYKYLPTFLFEKNMMILIE